MIDDAHPTNIRFITAFLRSGVGVELLPGCSTIDTRFGSLSVGISFYRTTAKPLDILKLTGQGQLTPCW